MVMLVECLEIDINDGFKSVVNNTVNEKLTSLQKSECVILDVSPPLVNGRKVYVTIRYDDPSVSLEE